MSRSNLPPARIARASHFVIHVGSKAAGFMDTRSKAEELAELLNDVPGCPPVTIEELAGPFPADYDAALRAIRARKRAKVENDVVPTRAGPGLRLIRGGR